jgi:hypothetical protein
MQWYRLLYQVQFNERLNGCSVVGCAVTVAPELLVLACRRDGTHTTRCVTPVTSNVTRASHVPSAGELIVLLHTGKWFSVGAVESKFRCLFLDHSFNRCGVKLHNRSTDSILALTSAVTYEIRPSKAAVDCGLSVL